MLISPEGGVIHVEGFIRAVFVTRRYYRNYGNGPDGGFHSSMDSLVWSHPSCWDNGHLSVSLSNNDFSVS